MSKLAIFRFLGNDGSYKELIVKFPKSGIDTVTKLCIISKNLRNFGIPVETEKYAGQYRYSGSLCPKIYDLIDRAFFYSVSMKIQGGILTGEPHKEKITKQRKIGNKWPKLNIQSVEQPQTL